jgi:hypothetical protein
VDMEFLGVFLALLVATFALLAGCAALEHRQ